MLYKLPAALKDFVKILEKTCYVNVLTSVQETEMHNYTATEHSLHNKNRLQL